MFEKRKVAVAVALGALGGIAVGAAPASAGAPQFACYSNEAPEEFVVLQASPGDENWVLEVRLCRLVKFPTHIGPYRP